MSFMSRLFRRTSPTAGQPAAAGETMPPMENGPLLEATTAGQPASEGAAVAPPEAALQQPTAQESVAQTIGENSSQTLNVQTDESTTGGKPRMAVQDEGVTYSEAQIAVH
jgi:hypothetical protein